MDNNNGETPTDLPGDEGHGDFQVERDPYPKMIIVCFLITLFFLFLVFFATLLDFTQRGEQLEIKPKNPEFFEEHLKTLPKSGTN